MYSQNQGGDVRRAGAKIRYRLKFVVVQLSARDKIIIKKVSLLRVRLSGRPGDVCPGKGLHMHGRTYSSVSRCALVKTAASSASSLLWLRSLRKQREARLYMAAKTKTGRSDRGDVQLSKNKTKTDEGSWKHAFCFIQRPESRHDDELRCKRQSQIPGKEVDKTSGLRLLRSPERSGRRQDSSTLTTESNLL